eukprot:4415933-Prymnesium_polylepis.2
MVRSSSSAGDAATTRARRPSIPCRSTTRATTGALPGQRPAVGALLTSSYRCASPSATCYSHYSLLTTASSVLQVRAGDPRRARLSLRDPRALVRAAAAVAPPQAAALRVAQGLHGADDPLLGTLDRARGHLTWQVGPRRLLRECHTRYAPFTRTLTLTLALALTLILTPLYPTLPHPTPALTTPQPPNPTLPSPHP